MRWPVALVLAGCTSVLGLDPTEGATDGDGDGVFDAYDNCPDVANPDQDPAACAFCRIGADLDRDGIDDGCDPCPRGRNDEDEDGDGMADACDPCPEVPGAPGEADADGDGIGDACDRLPEPGVRRFFDGFDRDLPAWTSSAPWPVSGGARTSSPLDSLELYAVRVLDFDPRWTVTLGFEVPTALGGAVGLNLFDDSRQLPLFCGVTSDNVGWHLFASAKGGSASEALGFVPAGHLDLHVYATGGGEFGASFFHCEAGGDAVMVPVTGIKRGFALTSAATTTFDYFDVVVAP